MTIFVGIDPGLTGAWAAITHDGHIISINDIPVMASGGKAAKVQRQINPVELASELQKLKYDGDVVMVALERTSAMPGQGVSSMFSMGDSYGAIRAAVAIKIFPCEHVLPQTWKRAMGLDSDKERCRAKAIQLFPNASEMLSRKKDHNRAEALLLSEWLRRKIA